MADFIHREDAEGQRRFEELLASRFPLIFAQIIEAYRGLLHLEMAAFARATCAAIDNRNLQEVAAHLAFIDELFHEAPSDLENAIYVSYLENVFLGRDEGRYRSARSGLSGRLAAALVDLEDHWKGIAEANRKRYFR
jgi:hypothetical protein